MRYLLPDEIDSALRRGKSVEHFLGSGKTPGSISWVELRPTQEGLELWFFEVEDVGDSIYTDIYTFPDTGDSSENPVAVFTSAASAVESAQQLYGVPPDQWLNQAVIHDLYAATKS